MPTRNGRESAGNPAGDGFQFWLAAEQDLVEAKGRIKEAAGALTGNDELRAEGKTDQAIGKVK